MNIRPREYKASELSYHCINVNPFLTQFFYSYYFFLAFNPCICTCVSVLQKKKKKKNLLSLCSGVICTHLGGSVGLAGLQPHLPVTLQLVPGSLPEDAVLESSTAALGSHHSTHQGNSNIMLYVNYHHCYCQEYYQYHHC